MEFSKNRIIRIVITLLFLCCMFFANFVAIRMILRYGVDAYFYDKLLVAYTIGGQNGLKLELDTISFSDNSRRESIMAKDFSIKLATLADPRAFLADKVQKNRMMIAYIRNLRSVAIVLMLLLFGWQFMVKSSSRFKPKH